MRRPASLIRSVQHTSQLAVSSVTLAELYAGACKHSQTSRLLALIGDLHKRSLCWISMQRVRRRSGRCEVLLRQGIAVPTADLMIATTALVHNVTLATHNTADYQNVPGLPMEDWLR